MMLKKDANDASIKQWLMGFAVRPIVVAVAIFALINLVLVKGIGSVPAADAIAQEGSSGAMSRSFTGWTARSYVDQKQAPDIVLFGSSQMGCAVFASDAHRLGLALDFIKHRRGATLELELAQRLNHPLKVFNWALGGSMVSDAYMESLALLKGSLKPKMVVIGISPRDFIDNSLQYPGATEEFRYFSRFVDPGNMTTAAFPDLIDRFDFVSKEKLPLRKIGVDLQHIMAARAEKSGSDHDRSNVASAATDEDPDASSSAKKIPRSANFLQGISTTGIDVNPGQWVMPAIMPSIFVDNTDEYMHRFHNSNPPGYAAQVEFFKRFLARMKDSDIKVLVVGMPCLSPNRALLPPAFWSKWRTNVVSMCAQSGASWLDLTDSPRFTIDNFLDTVHMNASGGAKFFDIVADYIAAKPNLVTCLGPSTDRTRSLAVSRSSVSTDK